MRTIEEENKTLKIRAQVKEELQNFYTPHMIKRFPKYADQKQKLRNYMNGRLFSIEIENDFITLLTEYKNN